MFKRSLDRQIADLNAKIAIKQVDLSILIAKRELLMNPGSVSAKEGLERLIKMRENIKRGK